MAKNQEVKKEEVKKENEIIKKIFKGVVVGDKMNKTIVVKVKNVKINSKYKKRFFTSTKFKVHDENNKFKIGDTVEFVECRPLSKDKKWRVINS